MSPNQFDAGHNLPDPVQFTKVDDLSTDNNTNPVHAVSAEYLPTINAIRKYRHSKTTSKTKRPHLAETGTTLNNDTQTPIPTDTNDDTTDETDDEQPSSTHFIEPTLTSIHYEQDPNWSPLFNYLNTGQLCGDKQTDYRTLLLAHEYIIENDRLYRLPLPKGRKRKINSPDLVKVVVISKQFENSVLVGIHEEYGHYSGVKLFQTARLLIFMDRLYEACREVAASCLHCQRMRINRAKVIPPMTPLPVYSLGEVIHVDHKSLPRVTKEGYTDVLCAVESYSGFVFYHLVKDTKSVTTAKAIIEKVLPIFPSLRGIITDKCSTFTSKVWQELTRIMHWKHASCASLNRLLTPGVRDRFLT